MLSVHCPVHGARVLIFADQIDAIDNTPDGIVVHYRCTCGHHGTVLTGRRRMQRQSAA